MESPELSIYVGEIIGVPKVTIRGAMAGWHDQAVSGILGAFAEQGSRSLVLDIAGLSFAGVEGVTGLINVLRSLAPSIGVHVVTPASASATLGRAGFGPSIRLYSSTDEIADCISASEEYSTSRWMAAKVVDAELPLAA